MIVLVGILCWFAGGTNNNDLVELLGANKAFMGVFIVLIFLLVIFIILSLVLGFGLNCKILSIRCWGKIPLSICGCCLILLLLAVGSALLAVRKIGETAITYACDEDEKDADGENANDLKKFFEKIYDNMDDYYCTDICPCKVDDTSIFDEGDSTYYGNLNLTGTVAINF